MDQPNVNGEEERKEVVNETETVRAGIKEWLGLALLLLPTLLLAIDFTVLHLALPHFAIDLQANSLQQLWILDIYGFMIASFLITMGTLGDRIGRRRLLMIGTAVFGVVSVIAAYSINAEMLLVSRALLGISGATLMPSTLSLISNMFQNTKERTMAISIWMMSFSGGAVLGPAVGGILLEFFWWGSVFLLGVPIMVVLFVLAPILLPEYRGEQAGRLDPISVVLSLVAILSIIFGMKQLASGGQLVSSILFLLTGFIIGWLFIKRQLILREPLLDLKLFRNKFFSASLSIMLLGTIVQGGYVLLFAQYLQMIAGLPPLKAGMWMIPLSVGSIIGSLLTPVFIQWFPRTRVIAIGLTISALAYMMMIFIGNESSITLPVVSSVLLTFGLGPLFVLTTDLVVGSAPAEKSGSAASLSETSGELGTALGVAVLGSVATAVYRYHMAALELDLPKLAERAKDTLAGAIGVVEQFPGSAAQEVLIQAQQSFMIGFKFVAAIGSTVLIGLVVLTMTLLGRVKQ